MEFEPPYIHTLLWYASAIVASLYFAWRYERASHAQGRSIYLLLCFIATWGFSALRLNVGNDYIRYIEAFNTLKEGYKIEGFGILFEGLYKLFTHFPAYYLWMFATTSLLTYLFIFTFLIKHNLLKYGVLFLFLIRFVIFSHDIIRQGLAIAIFLHVIDAWEERKFIRYIFLSLLMCAAHTTTGILMALILPLVRMITLGRFVWIAAIVVTYILGMLGIFQAIVMSIPQPDLGGRYLDQSNYITETLSFGFGSLYVAALGVIVACNLHRLQYKRFGHLYLFGVVLSNIFLGLFLFQRIADCFVLLGFIPFADLMQSWSAVDFRKISTITVIITYFTVQILFAKEKHGAVPYQTWVGYSLDEIENFNAYYPERNPEAIDALYGN